MKYKVGDRVRIKSLDWYNENKDSNGNIVFSSKIPHFSLCVNVRTVFTKDMVNFCGKVITIESVWTVNYSIGEGTYRYYFTDEMIECKVETLKYEVGDKVQIKDINWYNENKDEDGDISCGEFNFVSQMSKFCGKILTIDVDFENGTYLMKEDTDGFVFTEEMFDVFAEEEVARLVDNLSSRWVNEFNLPQGYQFVDENGNVINATKIVLEKKEKEYPKTYEECCEILEDVADCSLSCFACGLLNNLQKLLLCRDAYWKLAGEEMGLGKPWEPDYTEESYEQGSPIKYVIYYTGTHITKGQKCTTSYILSFPTAEMRDAFYENFKELINECKELL